MIDSNHDNDNINLWDFYLSDFVVIDIKIAVYLESPWKINSNLVSDFLVSEVSQKDRF